MAYENILGHFSIRSDFLDPNFILKQKWVPRSQWNYRVPKFLSPLEPYTREGQKESLDWGSLYPLGLWLDNLILCPRALVAVRRWSKPRAGWGLAPAHITADCSVLCSQSRSPCADNSSNWCPFPWPRSCWEPLMWGGFSTLSCSLHTRPLLGSHMMQILQENSRGDKFSAGKERLKDINLKNHQGGKDQLHWKWKI